MADKITKDYALLLDNLRHALYMSKNNPYTESGSVFFLDSAYNYMRDDLQNRFMKKRKLGDPPFFSSKEYNYILDLYKATPEAGDNKEQINQMIFWMAHLAGWKRENFVLKDPKPTISIIFRDTKRAPKIYGQQLKQDLEKTRYKVIGGKSILYTTGASVKDGVSEDTAEKSRVASEYIVMCNYHIVSEYCGEGKKQLLKKVITGFAGNIVEAERKREQKGEHSLIPNNKKEVETLCEGLDRMMKAYDLLPVDETVKKDWLLARSLSWLAIGAMLRQNLSMELLEDYLKPYLPETVEHGTVEVMHTERTSANIVPSLSVQEQFWQAGKKWYEEARKPGARFHSLDIVNHILPSAENKPAESEYCFPFRATDTNENTIQCARFSELLRDKNSIYHQGHFMLIGEGGIGKTTTLMSAMQDTYKGKDTYKGESVIPLFVELSLAPDSQDSHAYDGTSSSVIHRLVYAMLQQKDSKKDRADLLRECMNEESSTARDTVRELLTSAADEEIRYVLLIDGLNEVSPEPFTGRSSSAQWRILQEIREMIEGYPNVTVILTGRQGAFIDHPLFHPFYLRGLVWEEIEDYLREKGKTDGEISLIQNRDKDLLKVLSIPMFLTMYVLLRDTEGITTRGELLKVFFHERFERRKNEYDVLHRQGDISERIDQDEEQSVSGKMTRGKITLPVQWMFLDILIPEIAAKMEREHDFRISKKDVRSLLDSLFKEQDSLYCGKYKGFSDICFSEQLQGEDLEDVISDFTEAYKYKPARYSSAFLRYCESSMGILYREGEKSYGFVHQHFRDYFAAVCNVNRMKIAHTAHLQGDTLAAKEIMQPYSIKAINPILMEYIGECLGEHHLNSDGIEYNSNQKNTVKHSNNDQGLIAMLFDIYRGIELDDNCCIYNLIEIVKRTRKNISGMDLHDLDLRKCCFYNTLMDGNNKLDLNGALINAGSWFAEGHTDLVNSIIFSPDGSLLVSVSEDNSARVWDLETGHLIRILKGHSAPVKTVSFNIDGRRIITLSSDGNALVWNEKNDSPIYILKNCGEFATFNADGNQIITGSSNGGLQVWESDRGYLIPDIYIKVPDDMYVNKTVFSTNGSFMLTVSEEGEIQVWDTGRGRLIHTLDYCTEAMFCAGLSPCGDSIAAACCLWRQERDGKTGKNVWRSIRSPELLKDVGHSGICKNSVVSTVPSHENVCVWDTKTGRLVFVLYGHSDSINTINYSSDGSRIITASSDGSARVWSARTGRIIHVLEGHADEVNYANFSKKGRYIVTISKDRSARIWNAESGSLIHVLKADGYMMKSAVFSEDENRIAISSYDNDIRVWDLNDGYLIHVLAGRREDIIEYVDFCDFDTKRIVTGMLNGYELVWDAMDARVINMQKSTTYWKDDFRLSMDGSLIVRAFEGGIAKVYASGTGLLHTLYVVQGLHIKGVDFRNINPKSIITDEQKEIFRQYGALI